MIELAGQTWTWVDAVFILVALLYAWQAFERGMVAVLCEFTAWMTAWMVCYLVRGPVTHFLFSYVGFRGSVARQWGLLFIVLAVQIIIYRVLMSLAKKLPRHYFSPLVHTLFAAVPAVVNGIFFAVFVLLVLLALPVWFPFKEDLAVSAVGEYLLTTRSVLGILQVNL